MKKLWVVFMFTCSWLLPSAVFAADPKFEMTFETNSGQIVVIDSFRTIRKSNLSIEDIRKMQSTIQQLQRKIEELEKKVETLERRK